MAKRKSFYISAQETPQFEDVGAMSSIPAPNATGSMSAERIAQLKALMAKPVSAAAKESQDNEDDRVDTLLPAHHEELIALDKLQAAPDQWNFFPMPKPEQYALIFQSIYKYGLWHPCTVWEQENGSYMILGGHTRANVFRELYEITNDEKYHAIPCKVYKHDQITEPTARRIVILTNIAQRAKESSAVRIRCYSEMARLEKEESFYGSGVDVNTAVAKIFGVSRSAVFFFRKLEKLIPELLDAYDERKITQAMAGILADIRPDLQKYIYEQNLHLTLTASIAKKLAFVETIDELKNVIETQKKPVEKYEYVFSTKVRKPSDFDFVPVAVSHKDVQAFKDFLTQSLDLADGLSDESKRVIREMLQIKQ